MSTRIFLAQLRERSGGLLYEYQQAMVYRWFSAARLAHWGGVFAGCTPNIEIACGSSLIKMRLKLGLAGHLERLSRNKRSMTLPPSTYIGCLLQTPTCLPTRMPLLRVPYTDPLPLPKIIPQSASTVSGAIAALTEFLSAPSSPRLKNHEAQNDKTLLLTGAGISVASGLADYRGTNGTYMLNKAYRPVYYHEFTTSHEARKRYWARSFLGWTNLHKAKPNEAHWAVKRFGELGRLSSVITQSISSLPATALSRLTIATRRRLIPSESASAASNARAARVPALHCLPYLPQRTLQRGVSEAACGPQSGLGCLS